MEKPLVLVVMDGVGFGKDEAGDCVRKAHTPYLDWLLQNCPNVRLKAHGTAVGLPSDDDMGNSEVGHNAIGCGQIYSQGAKLVNESIASGKMFESEVWRELVDNVRKHGTTLHLIGLFSDGNVHSHINHVKAMIEHAKKDGVAKVRLHILLDGRDVPPMSALTYVEDIERFFAGLNDASFDARIASGGGRMYITMDRYQADWPMVKRGWDTHVHGEGRKFASATEAIQTYRSEIDPLIDQDMHEFVIVENGKPVGTIEDNDSVIFFNFRGDRAIELSMAFDYDAFDKFDRGRRPKVLYAGMLQYDGDLKLPDRYLVNPPSISNTLTEFLVGKGVNEFAISETQKYGHVTYFWNGNRSGKVSEELETYVEIPSDNVPFDQRPWMKSAEITDRMIEAIRSGKYGFLRLNYPNGDMVGHTGVMESTMIGVESVDLGLKRLMELMDSVDFTLVVTADHGNADDMLRKKKDGGYEPKTSHSLNPVPFIIYDRTRKVEFADGQYGLANIAATVVELLGFEPMKIWEKSMLK